jgi:hypothetical protein
MNVLMLVSDAEAFSNLEAARGGLLSGTHWEDVEMSMVLLSSSSRSAPWNLWDAPFESILWEVWGEIKDFL